MKLFIIIVTALLFSCSKKAVIEQEIEIAKICPESFRVTTNLWVRDYDGSSICIERQEYSYGLTRDVVDETSREQLIIVKEHLKSIEACLSEKNIKVSPKTYTQQSLNIADAK